MHDLVLVLNLLYAQVTFPYKIYSQVFDGFGSSFLQVKMVHHRVNQITIY